MRQVLQAKGETAIIRPTRERGHGQAAKQGHTAGRKPIPIVLILHLLRSIQAQVVADLQPAIVWV
jgi:hypothetical protein